MLFRASAFMLMASMGLTQTPDQTLKFEVASIRPAAPVTIKDFFNLGQQGGPGTDDPERIRFRSLSIRSLILTAFVIRLVQLAAPEWLNDLRNPFEIVAKVPPGASKNDVKLMLQDLVLERFGLVFHRETKELPSYELVIAKNGPKLRAPSEEPNAQSLSFDEYRNLRHDQNGIHALPSGRPFHITSFTGDGDTVFEATQQSIAQLCQDIELHLGQPVMDRTGLSGKYNWAFEFSNPGGPPGSRSSRPTTEAPSHDPAPTIFIALQQELGLKLEPTKLPVEILVIDHLERMPTEN